MRQCETVVCFDKLLCGRWSLVTLAAREVPDRK